MMPDSAPMSPHIPGQKRKKQRNSMPKPTTFINVAAEDFRSQVQQLTGLPPQPMTSFMQYQQSQLYPNQNSNATSYAHPSTNEGPSSFDRNQHFLQNISQGNQGASNVDRVAPRAFGVGCAEHSQPWMEGHNSKINLSLGTQSYLGNINSVQQTPNTLLPNFQPHYQSGNTFGMNDNPQINSAFVPYKSQISQQMSRNYQNVSNSETSKTSMNQNSGKTSANEEEQFNNEQPKTWSDFVKKDKRFKYY
uniref:VQ domain-containing protein n=1 Tax=Meloidogyne javanica TaxID=6303 RepID=A0A915M748_MELJA